VYFDLLFLLLGYKEFRDGLLNTEKDKDDIDSINYFNLLRKSLNFKFSTPSD